jgi:predicted HicB family RNase H-like nuclease
MPRRFKADVVILNFRIPVKLHERLEKIARERPSSLNSELVRRLEASLLQSEAKSLDLAENT